MWNTLRAWLRARYQAFVLSAAMAHAQGKTHEPVNQALYLFTLVFWAFALFCLLVHRMIFGDSWLAYETLWLVLTALSVGVTGKSDRVLIWILNKPAFEWPSWLGVYFAPFWISSVTMIPMTVYERELPDGPEWVQYGDDKEPLKARIDPETGRMREPVRPIRITTGGEMAPATYKALRPRNGNANDAGPSENLNYLMTVGQQIVLRYKIEHGFDFYINSKGKTIEEKIAYVEKEMADFAVRELKAEYVKYSVGGVLIMHPDIEEDVLGKLQIQVQTWGVKLEQTVIKPPDVTHELNSALAGKPIASANAQAAAMTGTGEGQRRGNITRGEAEGERDAAGMLNMTPKDMRLIDRVTDALGDNAKYVLGTAGIAEALGVPGAVQKLLPDNTTPPAQQPAQQTNPNGGSTT